MATLSEETKARLQKAGFTFESVLVYGKRTGTHGLILAVIGSEDLLREGTLWVGGVQRVDSEGELVEYFEKQNFILATEGVK